MISLKKKLNSALIAVCALFFCGNKEHEVHQNEDYFPLQVGNYWEFKSIVPKGTYAFRIDSKKKIDGKEYFRMIREKGFSRDTVFYRKDPFWVVYERRKGLDEVIKYNFGVPAGFHWEYKDFNGEIWVVTLISKSDMVKSGNYIFGKCYRYFNDVVQSLDEESEWWLAPRVGVVKYECVGGMSSQTLVKARINGIEKEYR